jgi:hypothetical protein
MAVSMWGMVVGNIIISQQDGMEDSVAPVRRGRSTQNMGLAIAGSG